MSVHEKLAAGAEVSLRHLRTEVPHWEWVAVRNGMMWNYEGRRGDKVVHVYPVSVIVGHYGDDLVETQWRVDDGDTSMSYASWWVKVC
jgi:hypothetical protein